MILILYNHKGGVSKTTTTFNLGHRLAERCQARVLLVDADPQCNLTELFLGDSIDEDKELPGTSLLEALRPRLEGRAHRVDAESIEVVSSHYNPNVMLFRGDIDLNTVEDQFATAHSQRLTDDVHYKYTYVAMHDMLQRLAARLSIRFILIDVGPSAGALTRSCFLSTDAFFVPTAPDRFNVQAISSLSKIIGRWLKDHGQVVDNFRALELPVAEGLPLFLGTVSQNFKQISGRPKKGYKLWLDRIPEAIQHDLVPVLTEIGKPREKDLLGLCKNESFEASQIPDFGSIVTLMQAYAKPIYAISQQDTALIGYNGRPFTGAAWQDAESRMAEWKDKFDDLVEVVLKAEDFINAG